jgi:FolB domain-containing protein
MAAESRLDRIHIRDLQARCILGTNREERVHRQDVVVNITLFADLRKACRSDRLEDTANYRDIKKRVAGRIESSSFYLVERLAEEIASLCLAEPRVRRVTVSVDKPGALRYARSVAVEITRERRRRA